MSCATLSQPSHFFLVPVNAIGYVDASLPKPKAREELTDELSTRPGLEVTVARDGNLKLRKKSDPNWDDSKDEPLSEASDEDGSEAEGSDDEYKKKLAFKLKNKADKKSKKEAKKRPNKDAAPEQVNSTLYVQYNLFCAHQKTSCIKKVQN